jgi:hypothetical protein
MRELCTEENPFGSSDLLGLPPQTPSYGLVLLDPSFLPFFLESATKSLRKASFGFLTEFKQAKMAFHSLL